MAKLQKEIVERELILLDKEEIIRITGWSSGVVNRLFAHDKDFPAIKIGKKCQVELSAFKKYLGTRRTSNM